MTESTDSSTTSTDGPLAGRRCLVTGGGRGIGRAIALRFAADGADVVITARSSDQLNETVDASQELAGSIHGVAGDVTDDNDVAAIVSAADDLLGGVDTLVNNAGVHAAGAFMDLGPEVYTRLFDVNVVSIVRLSQALLPGMIERGFGRVINLGSTAGLFESPSQAPYNATKHAVVGLTRCMGLELAPTGVTVNAICPGFVDTEMLGSFADDAGVTLDEFRAGLGSRTPIGRILAPDEIAHLAAHIASPLAGGMTGQTVVVSCGMRMH